MSSMAVCTAGDLLRETEPVVLAMVAFHVSLYSDVEDAVTFHHLLVAMALHAHFGVEFAVGVGFGISQGLDVMEVVAVVAGCRILVACCNGLAVNGLLEDSLFFMTLYALRDNNAFVLLPVSMGVDVGVAVGTFHIVLDVDAVVMFCILLFVATLAMDLGDLGLAPHMPGKIGDLHVTAGTSIFTMD